MTWVAFDRGIKSAEQFGFKRRWRRGGARATLIHRDVCEKGFDRELNSFVESYGSKLLDASILMLPSVGFLPPTDPRVRGTLDAIERHMMRDGFVLRHDPREVSDETPTDRRRIPGLYALARGCLRAGGRIREGGKRCLTGWSRSQTISGCLAEEFDTVAGRQTGNFPQALTHIALINTAHNLSEAKPSADKPAMQRSK